MLSDKIRKMADFEPWNTALHIQWKEVGSGIMNVVITSHAGYVEKTELKGNLDEDDMDKYHEYTERYLENLKKVITD